MTLDAAWKGWDFRVFFQGVAKRDLWLDGCYFWGANAQGNEWQSTGFVEHWDFWRPEGDPLGANLDAYYPKVNFDGGRNAQVQTRYIQNGAYIRMKTFSWDILCRKHGLRMPVYHRYVFMYQPTIC